MNREILFKAKRIDNGEWVEGWLLKDEVTGQCFIHASGNSVNESDKVNEEGCLRFIAFEVDENTICQYTGLTDKNGNKIWENDVVFVTDEDGCSGRVDTCIGEIEFYEGLWYINGRVQNGLYDIDKCFHIEVIGNIFDNPEFLKEGVEE